MMTEDNMPQTQKENPEDGFHLFFLDVKKKVQERGDAFISEMIASMWEHMKLDERSVYEEQARNEKQNLCQVDFKNKERVPNRDNGQIRMNQEIEEIVRKLECQDSLKTHPFHLVHVNYYCKNGSGRYLGCEIALAEFSFVDGVRKTYHTFINPGAIPVGYAILASKHVTETHLIPLPPDGFGRESDHLEILNNIRLFLMGEDGAERELPPLYTRPGDIDAVESVLWQLRESAYPYTNARRQSFRVYSVCKLFHELRNASMYAASAVILHPNFLADHELINDALEFTKGISCDFHEELKAMRHCSLSYVQRWTSLIMEQCCGPLAIEMIPGQHCDLSTHLSKKAKAAYLGTKIRCSNPNTVHHDMSSSRSLSGQPLSPKNKCQETTLMQKKPMQQVRAEGAVTPRYLQPLRPLCKPRTPIELILMRAFRSQKGRIV